MGVVIFAWASSEANLESETVPARTDLDCECCADDLPEPDLLDWGLEPFTEAEDLPNATEVLDSALWDDARDPAGDDTRDADIPGACIKLWLTELWPENDDTSEAGLSVTATSSFDKLSASS